MKSELRPEILLSAYAQGIFPMADPDSGEIQWFSPDPRAVMDLDDFHVPRTLRQVIRQQRFEVRINSAFEAVMRCCADREEGTWISEDIIEAYTHLHALGFAHSVECHREGELAGGLYGVSIGGAFFGESMFHQVRDASKVALAALVERLRTREFALLDVQFMTEHLARFGARRIPRREYLRRLAGAIALDCAFVGEIEENCR
jgi:leucyl/phenylalanyl-tRNA---protein transferase